MEESEIDSWYQDKKEEYYNKYVEGLNIVNNVREEDEDEKDTKKKKKKPLTRNQLEERFRKDMLALHAEYHKKHILFETNQKRKERIKKVLWSVAFPFIIIWKGLKVFFHLLQKTYRKIREYYIKYIGEPYFHRIWQSHLMHKEKKKVKRKIYIINYLMAPFKAIRFLTTPLWWPFWAARRYIPGYIELIKEKVKDLINKTIDLGKTSLELAKKAFEKTKNGITTTIAKVKGFYAKWIKPLVELFKTFLSKFKKKESDDL
jgi:hypothetical protein